MAITKPVLFTSIEDKEVVFQRPVSEEVVRKMIQNSNLLGSLALIGSVRCVAINQPGAAAAPDTQFQLANGDEITNPQSPLSTLLPTMRFTPDLTNKYIRGAADEMNNVPGGNYTLDMRHSHSTGLACTPTVGEEGDEQPAYVGGTFGCHNHTVPLAFSATEPLEPAHQEVAVYLKIV